MDQNVLNRGSMVGDLADEYLEKAAAEYGRLGYHPESHLSGEPGRMFWQVLDDATWAMYAAGAYMKVRSSLQERQCKAIEDSLFRPIAGFLMYGTEDNPKNNFVFNRIHNHGSWLVAAVGALGFALGDRTLVDKALLGTDLSGCNGGFLKQLDELFSPDGYYVEGVAYQRYALIPCLYFAKLLDRERPELHIFERNSGALLKSADAFLAQSYDGTFFLVNDCDVKSFSSADLTSSLCTIYSRDTSRKWLLDIIARYAGRVTPDEDGRLVSRDIAAGKAEPAVPHSAERRASAEFIGKTVPVAEIRDIIEDFLLRLLQCMKRLLIQCDRLVRMNMFKRIDCRKCRLCHESGLRCAGAGNSPAHRSYRTCKNFALRKARIFFG